MIEIAQKHGIKPDEYKKIVHILGREPNLTEVGVFGAMWSEHCSYKSTRVHLKNLYTKNKNVICGPGENAGVVDAGGNDAIIFKMESHNHPSYIEPFNGAATGVGGILRDIFTMGARPIANVNSLKFGNIDHGEGKMRSLVKGVVHGISFYGNCVGVPMVFGETKFDESYNGNILVNAMSVGIAKKDKIFYSAASEIGASVVYFGSKTGKDGINGAKMSSASFSKDDENQKPTVQVGDPFYEKLLIEATLELMESGIVLAIQDMGAAGLTCSTAEMAAKGNAGIEIWLENVPMREQNMTAYEIMLSESQERMLMTIKKEHEPIARKILEKWDLDFAVIGVITNSKNMVVKYNGKVEADIPVNPLSEDAPKYNRPYKITTDENITITNPTKSEKDLPYIIQTLISSYDICSRRQIYERYDRGVGGGVFECSPSSFGVVKIGDPYEVTISADDQGKNYALSQVMLSKLDSQSGCSSIDFLAGNQSAKNCLTYQTQKALIITSSVNPHYTQSNTKEGVQYSVVKTYKTICLSGGTPLALTNCLNFGSPEKEKTMGDIVSAINGLTEACTMFDYPVISGNVSLYNETDGVPIKPTPTVAGVGVIQDYTNIITERFKEEGDMIFVLGETVNHLTNTLYARNIEGKEEGKIPQISLKAELEICNFASKAIKMQLISSAFDVSSGGIIMSLVKNAIKSDLGFVLNLDDKTEGMPIINYLFSEFGARAIVCVPKEKSTKFIEFAIDSNIIHNFIGFVCGKEVNINNKHLIPLKTLQDAYFSTINIEMF